MADGTADKPITFTALDADKDSTATVDSDTASAGGNAALGTPLCDEPAKCYARRRQAGLGQARL